jgi:hypothetical protein
LTLPSPRGINEMSRVPIEMIIDRLDLRCTIWKSPRGVCNCWSAVTLRCPVCEAEKSTFADSSDPPGTAIVEAPCPNCEDGRSVRYFDERGLEIAP